MKNKVTITKEHVETMIGNLLIIGVMLSAGITLIGGILYLLRHYALPIDYGTFRGSSPELHTIGGVLNAALHFNAKAIMQAGILILLATPIARVTFSVFIFLKERDYLYVVVTLIVLAILIYSITGGWL